MQKVHYKKSLLAMIALVALGGVATAVATDPPPPEREDFLTVRVNVDEYLEIHLNNITYVTIGQLESGTSVNAENVSVFVSTNRSEGYKLNIDVPPPDPDEPNPRSGANMAHTDASVSAVIRVVPGTMALNDVCDNGVCMSAWGWRWQDDPDTSIVAGNKFRTISDTFATLVREHTTTAYEHETVIRFGAFASRTQEAGEYEVDVRFTAIGR